jgi:alkanesulfonate monooxygenase SsuD/methylene tetrahydromethanopterin reductase-like flavin-dependent oxidoreductase (luciferase family)
VHHRVDGAKRGPAPAHDIELWLGAYKPRMQRLIGAKADGWLPGMAYLGSLSALTRGNAIIDEAAEAAGRSPAEVRRLLDIDGTIDGNSGFPTGDADDWAEQLATLALTDGVSTFILSSDDDRAIEQFAREIAPEVRRRGEADSG